MSKKIFIIIFVTSLILTGCWSRTEVNDIAIVLGVAIDKAENDNLRLSLQIAVPKGLGPTATNQGKATTLISAEGKSIMEVYRQIQEKIPRDIFFAHSRVIIVGEELAREGVSPLLDFFSRHRQSHLRNYLLITSGEASDILKLTPRFESIMAEEIREQEKRGVGIQTQVRDFLEQILNEGEEPVTAKISNLSLEAKGENEGENAGTSEETPTLNGAAIFKEDKLIGWMDDKEARGILWFRNELNTGIVTVQVPEYKNNDIGAQIIQSSTKIKPILENDKVKFKIETNSDIQIFENNSTMDLSDPKVITTIKQLFEKDLKERMQLTLDKTKNELNSDIFGFGQALYRTYPREWENLFKKRWDELFPELEINISTHVTIKGTGFSTKSMSLPKETE